MTKLAVVPINAALHARAGRHYGGDWLAILPAVPEFSLVPVGGGENELPEPRCRDQRVGNDSRAPTRPMSPGAPGRSAI
jgi:hypothetical protein